jgi:hypothetical protein
MDRREFVRGAALTGAAVASGKAALGQAAGQEAAAVAAPYGAHKTFVGIQLDIGRILEEGVDRVLDDLQRLAHVNALFLYSVTYMEGRVHAQTTGNFRGGNYATVHPQYYKDTLLKPEDTRAPEFPTFDVLATVVPAARKRGMKTFCWIIEDNELPRVPNMDKLWEVDLHGRPVTRHPGGPCFTNPNYTNYLLGLVEDYCRSYEVDGIMFGSERMGPLGSALGAYHNGSRADPGMACCFCSFCEAKARRTGIDFARVKLGYLALEAYVRAGRAGKRPVDGYFVAYQRVLEQYPEVMVWEKFWTSAQHDTYAALHARVKSINPNLQAGWHIWQNSSWNPTYRAEQDFAAMAPYTDYVKPVLYNNCAGERMISYMASVLQNIHGDMTRTELLEYEYKVLNYNEAPLEKLAAVGFSADYVYRETKRTVDSLAGTQTLVWPGIDVDVPTGGGSSKCTPEGVRDAVLGAYKGGAQGVVLSRSYSEMKAENLRGAGVALEQLGLA